MYRNQLQKAIMHVGEVGRNAYQYLMNFFMFKLFF